VNIVQIVPALPPSINGVGDYALFVAKELRRSHDIESEFIVDCRATVPGVDVERFEIEALRARSRRALVSALGHSSSTVVVLHYVGYGYASRGCPNWLVEGLREWCRANSRGRIVTIFHEISAFGPPWRSAFWLSAPQKILAKRLVHLSDACITSGETYRQILQSMSGASGPTISTLPIFSNVGEPDNVPPLGSRSRRAVIFGGAATKRRVYGHSLKQFGEILGSLRFEEICDIGPPCERAFQELNGIPIVMIGARPAREVSVLLQDAVIGLFDCPGECLAKSGVFAAYCAHGLAPVGFPERTRSRDGLAVGREYLGISRGELFTWRQLNSAATAARGWYQSHRLSRHAAHLAELVASDSTIGRRRHGEQEQ